MPMLPANAVAKQLGVGHTLLHYYYKQGRITTTKAGGILLLDPEVTRRELEEIGYFRRKENRMKRRSKKRVPES